MMWRRSWFVWFEIRLVLGLILAGLAPLGVPVTSVAALAPAAAATCMRAAPTTFSKVEKQKLCSLESMPVGVAHETLPAECARDARGVFKGVSGGEARRLLIELCRGCLSPWVAQCARQAPKKMRPEARVGLCRGARSEAAHVCASAMQAPADDDVVPALCGLASTIDPVRPAVCYQSVVGHHHGRRGGKHQFPRADAVALCTAEEPLAEARPWMLPTEAAVLCARSDRLLDGKGDPLSPGEVVELCRSAGSALPAQCVGSAPQGFSSAERLALCVGAGPPPLEARALASVGGHATVASPSPAGPESALTAHLFAEAGVGEFDQRHGNHSGDLLPEEVKAEASAPWDCFRSIRSGAGLDRARKIDLCAARYHHHHRQRQAFNAQAPVECLSAAPRSLTQAEQVELCRGASSAAPAACASSPAMKAGELKSGAIRVALCAGSEADNWPARVQCAEKALRTGATGIKAEIAVLLCREAASIDPANCFKDVHTMNIPARDSYARSYALQVAAAGSNPYLRPWASQGGASVSDSNLMVALALCRSARSPAVASCFREAPDSLPLRARISLCRGAVDEAPARCANAATSTSGSSRGGSELLADIGGGRRAEAMSPAAVAAGASVAVQYPLDLLLALCSAARSPGPMLCAMEAPLGFGNADVLSLCHGAGDDEAARGSPVATVKSAALGPAQCAGHASDRTAHSAGSGASRLHSAQVARLCRHAVDTTPSECSSHPAVVSYALPGEQVVEVCHGVRSTQPVAECLASHPMARGDRWSSEALEACRLKGSQALVAAVVPPAAAAALAKQRDRGGSSAEGAGNDANGAFQQPPGGVETIIEDVSSGGGVAGLSDVERVLLLQGGLNTHSEAMAEAHRMAAMVDQLELEQQQQQKQAGIEIVAEDGVEGTSNSLDGWFEFKHAVPGGAAANIALAATIAALLVSVCATVLARRSSNVADDKPDRTTDDARNPGSTRRNKRRGKQQRQKAARSGAQRRDAAAVSDGKQAKASPANIETAEPRNSPSAAQSAEHSGLIKVGNLGVCTDSVLGYGSHGTLVLAGVLDSRPVAVKRMLRHFHRSADREISLLIHSDGHPNVVRYFLKEERGEFVYLALELCLSSLHDAVRQMQKTPLSGERGGQPTNAALANAVPSELRESLKRLVEGIAHLHEQRIVHRDLKPGNILIAPNTQPSSPNRRSPKAPTANVSPPSSPTTSAASTCATAAAAAAVRFRSPADLCHFTLKISDMGLGKLLLDGQSGCSLPSVGGGTLPNNAGVGGVGGPSVGGRDDGRGGADLGGTVGWQAPEILALRSCLSEEPVQDAAGGSLPSAVTAVVGEFGGGISRRRHAQSVDIFALGCMFQNLLVPGSHPFGREWFKREANIMAGRSDVSPLAALPGAEELVRSMISADPRARPTAVQVAEHPFFWSDEQQLSFLVDISDRLDQEAPMSALACAMEANAHAVVGHAWDERLPLALVRDCRYRSYDTSSVVDCLRVLRNTRHHYHELDTATQSLLAPLPIGLVRFWLAPSAFPVLLMHCWHVACDHLSEDPAFARYIGNETVAICRRRRAVAGEGAEVEAQVEAREKAEAEVEATAVEKVGSPNAAVKGVVWSESKLSESISCRGWWRPSAAHWERGSDVLMSPGGFTSLSSSDGSGGGARAAAKRGGGGGKKPPTLPLLKASMDSRFRTRLCAHWERSGGLACPMRAHGVMRCVFAHGPLELRVRVSRAGRWGSVAAGSVAPNGDSVDGNPRASGGEDTLGAARGTARLMGHHVHAMSPPRSRQQYTPGGGGY